MRDESGALWLTGFLRFGAAVLLLAFGAVFLPVAWMSSSHAALGLGSFPRSALVDYLTRSIAALYAIKGGLYLVLSTDVVRYAPVIGYVAWSTIGFGLLMLCVDLHAGMPWYWTWSEGPIVTVVGLILLGLHRLLDAGTRRA
jgi:hypothetical protein